MTYNSLCMLRFHETCKLNCYVFSPAAILCFHSPNLFIIHVEHFVPWTGRSVKITSKLKDTVKLSHVCDPEPRHHFN